MLSCDSCHVSTVCWSTVTRAAACLLYLQYIPRLKRTAVAGGGVACKTPHSRPDSADCLVSESCRNGDSRTVPYACVADSVAATRSLEPFFVTCQLAGDELHDRRLGIESPNCSGINSRIGNGSSVLPMYFGGVW